MGVAFIRLPMNQEIQPQELQTRPCSALHGGATGSRSTAEMKKLLTCPWTTFPPNLIEIHSQAF